MPPITPDVSTTKRGGGLYGETMETWGTRPTEPSSAELGPTQLNVNHQLNVNFATLCDLYRKLAAKTRKISYICYSY